MAVLPVCRSPMISSRWPRPIGVIASIALIPVCSGSFTLLRCDHRGGLRLQRRAASVPLDVALAVQRHAQRVHDPAEEAVAHRDGQDLAGAADLLALLDLAEVTEDDHADLALVQVEREAADTAGELEQLARHRRGKALDTRDAIAAFGDDADLFPGCLVRLVRLDEARQRVPDLVGPDCQLRHGPRVFLVSWLTGLCAVAGVRRARASVLAHQAASRLRSAASRLATLPSMSSSPIWTDMPPTTPRIDEDIQVNLVAVRGRERRDQPLALAGGQRDGDPHDSDQPLPPLARRACAYSSRLASRLRPRGCSAAWLISRRASAVTLPSSRVSSSWRLCCAGMRGVGQRRPAARARP